MLGPGAYYPSQHMSRLLSLHSYTRSESALKHSSKQALKQAAAAGTPVSQLITHMSMAGQICGREGKAVSGVGHGLG